MTVIIAVNVPTAITAILISNQEIDRIAANIIQTSKNAIDFSFTFQYDSNTI